MTTENYQEQDFKSYTDRVDITFDISLHEYGIIRNPDTGDTIFCLNPTDYLNADDDYRRKYRHATITKEDIVKALIEIEEGYFDFIGVSRTETIASLDNDHLAFEINTINSYNGHFE